MKKLLMMFLAVGLSGTSALANDYDNDGVRWRSIVGVITAPSINNPVSTINAGATAWTVRSGHASVNLRSGLTSFEVEGLVINGTAASGTPGAITTVVGTLVCGAGGTTQVILDSPPVSLSEQGDARFFGHLSGIPASCAKPLSRPYSCASRRCGTLDCHRGRTFRRRRQKIDGPRRA